MYMHYEPEANMRLSSDTVPSARLYCCFCLSSPSGVKTHFEGPSGLGLS